MIGTMTAFRKALCWGPCVLLASLLGCQGQSGIDDRGSETDHWWDALPRAEWRAFERIDIEDDWFEVYRVADQVYALYEPGQFEEVISFLIVGRRKALLFDTGLGIGDVHGVVSQLANKPVIVLNSHGHYDHVGGNYQFETIIARQHPYTLARSRGLSHEAVAEFISEGWIWKDYPAGFDPAAYRSRPWQVSQFVEDREFLDLGGISLEIIATPGHAPDGISLLDSANRRLFTGDTFYPATLYAHLPGSDFQAYRESAKRLAALSGNVDLLFTSHNVPTASADYLQALDRALDNIAGGNANYQLSDGAREYRFDGFSVLTHDPPR